MTVKKKSKKKAVPLTVEQRLSQEVKVFQEQAQARAKIAQRTYDAQDKETKQAIDALTNRIVTISKGIAAFKIKGRRIPADVPVETVRDNAFYLATEILKDLASLDVRVANFKFDPKRCSSCGKPMTKKVKK